MMGRGGLGRLALLGLAAVLAAVFLLPAIALAAPAEYIGLSELGDAIEADPDTPIQGYMLTVLRRDQVETLTVEVLGITSDTRPLILFQGTDARFATYGGMVAGMSGSPIYVDLGEGYKPIGALSYGDYFTLGSMGLATPIEPMIQIEEDYAGTTSTSLSNPVHLPGKVIDEVVITSDPVIAEEAGRDTVVVKPLSALYLGGIDPGSKAFAAMKMKMTAKGQDLVPLARALGSKPAFETELRPGAAVAALQARGYIWFGGIGTVTYVNGDYVVAFGHPMVQHGQTALALANAWIDGIWPNSMWAYKLGAPGQVRGTLTQDRYSGIMGTTAVMPLETTVTATANFDGRTLTGETYIPRWAINQTWYDGIGAVAAWAPGQDLVDAETMKGSAITTTTVVVHDGTDEHTIVRTNVFDSEDIAYRVVDDVAEMVWAFEEVNENGLANADILSVALESEISKSRLRANVVDVEAPEGLQTGDNHLVVSVLRYGVPATETVDVTLTIPAGTPLLGDVEVTSPNYYDEEMYEDYEFYFGEDEEGYGLYGFGKPDRRSVLDVVDELSDYSPNSEFTVRFVPEDPSEEEDIWGMSAAVTPAALLDPVVAKKDTDWYVVGEGAKAATQIDGKLSAATISYSGSVRVSGSVLGAQKSGSLKIFGRAAGASVDTLLATVPVTMSLGEATFSKTLTGLQKNTALTLRWDGDDETLASEKALSVKVRARVATSASPTRVRAGRYSTLKSTVSPLEAAGTVYFEYYKSRRWVRITSKSLSASASSVTHKWKVPRGKWKVRTRYSPSTGATNASATGSTIYVTGY